MATATQQRGRSSTTKEVRSSGQGRPRSDSLNREAWIDFLRLEVLHKEAGGHDPTRARGKPLFENDQRAIHRWRYEGTCPTIWTADNFLTTYSIHLNEFFLFCEEVDVSPWSVKGEPEWHRRDDWTEDLESSDPLWRRDAAALYS